jgi:hypothetical protein
MSANNSRKRNYQVLGGVIAPAEAQYSIQGMPSPLLQRQSTPLNTTPPSLRFNTGVANLRNFNPYTRGVAVDLDKQVPHESYKLAYSKRRFTTNVQLNGKPAMSPILKRKSRNISTY